MQRTRRSGTAPEVEVRAALRAVGLRYRIDYAPCPTVRTRADVAFPGAKVAVFIDGCFWHGCPQHSRPVKTHAGYWDGKIARNRQRDIVSSAALVDSGWVVIRVWAHAAPSAAASEIAAIVDHAKRGVRSPSLVTIG